MVFLHLPVGVFVSSCLISIMSIRIILHGIVQIQVGYVCMIDRSDSSAMPRK